MPQAPLFIPGTQTTPPSGGGAPVVLVDPVAPALNDQWILHTPFIASTGYGATTATTLMNGAGTGQFVIEALSLDPDVLLPFFVTPGEPAYVLTLETVVGPGINITPNSASGLHVQFPVGTLIQDLVDAINNYLAVFDPDLPQPVISLSVPADGALAYTTVGLAILNLTENGQAESYVYKIQGQSQVFQLQFF